MPKNKAQAAKRRAAKALKRKKKKQLAKANRSPMRSNDLLGTLFKHAQLPYWYNHGANYFASSYEEGLWNPVYEGIYEGLKALNQDQLIAKVATRYTLEGDEPAPQGIPVLAWCAMPPAGVIGVYNALIGNLVKSGMTQKDAEKVAVEPHNTAVWAFFEDLRGQIGEQVEKNGQ